MWTRGWYEYYVVDDARKEISLALQFYEWGDAVPGNALCELRDLRAMLEHLGGRVPVQLVRGLLEDNLGESFVQRWGVERRSGPGGSPAADGEACEAEP